MSQLSYKQLQGKLKAVKEQGYQLNVKLNAKQEALQLEWERISAGLETQVQEALAPTAADELQGIDQQYCNFFPATNTQEVDPQSCYTTEFREAKLFVIGGADYFMYELEQWLRDNRGAACEVRLTTESIEAAEAKASLFGGGFELPVVAAETQVHLTSVPSIVGLLSLLLAVLLLLALSICSKAWLGLKAIAVATGEPTCTQAAQNAEWLYGCALAFIQGLAVPDQQGGGFLKL